MINKLKKIFFKDKVISNTKEFSNQYLVDRVVNVFKEVMHRKSFDNQMMYDCSFLIFLPPEIYNDIELQTPLLSTGMIRRFYEEINKYKDKYEKYLPLANEWHIHFAPTNIEQDPAETDLETKINIMSYITDIKWEDLTSEEVEKVSINGKNSKYSKWNINQEVLGRINIIEKGRFTLKFNPDLKIIEDTSAVIGGSGLKEKKDTTDVLATVSFYEDSKLKTFPMKENILQVSRSTNANDKLTKDHLFIKTDDRGLKPNHFTIKFNPEARSFSIVLFAQTTVNEKSLAISLKGSEIWHPLTKESTILCGMTQIDFNALK